MSVSADTKTDLFSKTFPSMDEVIQLGEFINASEKRQLDFAEMLDAKAAGSSAGDALALGAGYCLIGRFSTAAEYLKKAKDCLEKFIILSYSLRRLGQFEEAAALLDNAGKAGADNLFVNLEKAAIYRDGKDFQKAQSCLKKCANYDKASAQYHYELGRCLYAQGQYEQAVENFQIAVEIEPNHKKSLFHLAFSLDIRGDEEAAIDYYKQLNSISPAPVSGLLNLAVLYEDAEKYNLAQKCVDQVLASHPNHPRAVLFKKDIESAKTMIYDEEIEKSKSRHHRLLETPVSDFELSVRSRNCLKKMNIHTIGDLLNISEAELLSYKNFGETSLSEIKHILGLKGLSLGMSHESKPLQINQMAAENDDINEELLAKPIEDFELSIRARNCLLQLNIRTVGELAAKTEAELLGCKNFGSTSLTEIRSFLTSMGLELRKIQ